MKVLSRSMFRFVPLTAAIIAITATGCSKKDDGSLEASGIIETTDITISARAAGPLVRMYVHEGDVVHAGDTLFTVDDSDLRLQRSQLVAGVDVARFQYDLVKNGARSEDVGQADEALRQAKLAMDNAADDVRRLGDLLKVGSVAEKDYDNAKNRYDISVRQYNAAKLGLEKLHRGSRPEDVSSARARREQAAAQVVALDKKIEDCVALAPGDGIVTRRAVDQGEFVNIGTGVVTISKVNPVKLKIYVAENELGRVKVGDTADVKIDTFNDRIYRGRVTYISPTAEFTPKNVQTKDDRVKLVFEVQIDVANPNGELKTGITAEAKLGGRTAPAK
ncbi:MAG TPA: efflux RND transporter periplasmic adaptor subunit [Candidatus Kapabacteria bacterium]|nr:efflux RND transporter periplasmic adaptor subunit [Candidatus Kapabacteria bacterium]